MKSCTALLSLVAATIPAVHGIAFAAPAPTDASLDIHLRAGAQPQPTQAPQLAELKPRQNLRYQNTCGYIDGNLTNPITCVNTRATCMLYNSASIGMAGCCVGSDTQDCGWTYNCIDLQQLPTFCNSEECLNNPFIRRCTESASPYCVSWTYPGYGITDYGCDSTSALEPVTLLALGTDGLGNSTTLALPELSGTDVRLQTTDTSPDVSSVAVSSTSSSGRSSPTPINDQTDDPPAKKTNIGLIVGVVVGVLALIIILVVGVFCFMKKKKKQRQLANNPGPVNYQQPPPPMQQQPQQPHQGAYMNDAQKQGGYAAVSPIQPPHSPPPQSGYMSPTFPQDQKFDGRTSVAEYGDAPQYNQVYANQGSPPMQHGEIHPQYYSPGKGGQAAVSPPLQQGMSPPTQYAYMHEGAHEVDTISSAHAPQGSGPVYEMGSNK